MFLVWPPPKTRGTICGEDQWLPTKLLDRELGLYEGLQQGLGRSMSFPTSQFKYRIIDGSLYLYLKLALILYLLLT
jgi:hypothetical protein